MGTALRRKKRRNFKVSRVMVSDLGGRRVWGCGPWALRAGFAETKWTGSYKMIHVSCIILIYSSRFKILKHIIYAYVDIYCDTVNMCEMIYM